MKRTLLSVVIAAAVAASAAAKAQDASAQEKPKDTDPSKVQSQSQAQSKSVRGSITSIDNAAKSFVVKDEASGKEVTIYWTGATKVNGDLKVGATVSAEAADQGGRMVATSIEATSAKKPY